MSQVVKVVNVFSASPDEPNSAFVPVSQNLEPGVIGRGDYGHYAVAEAEPLPGKSVPRSAEDSRVFDRDDLT